MLPKPRPKLKSEEVFSADDAQEPSPVWPRPPGPKPLARQDRSLCDLTALFPRNRTLRLDAVLTQSIEGQGL